MFTEKLIQVTLDKHQKKICKNVMEEILKPPERH